MTAISSLLSLLLLSLTYSSSLTQAYVDFGTQTIGHIMIPTFSVVVPHHFDPYDPYHTSREHGHYSHITAIAPSASVFRNGSAAMYYSIHSVSITASQTRGSMQPLGVKGVFARQNAVFGTQLFGGGPTNCCACDATGTCPSVTCTPVAYSGVFSGVGGLTNGTTNTSVIDLPATTMTRLPCCPVCSTAPPNSTHSGSFTATTGVFSPTSVNATATPNSSGRVSISLLTTTSTSVSTSISTISVTNSAGSVVVSTTAIPVTSTISILEPTTVSIPTPSPSIAPTFITTSTSISISTTLTVSTDANGSIITSTGSVSIPVVVTNTISSVTLISSPVVITSIANTAAPPPRTSVTVTAPITTRTRVTLSVETITPTITSSTPVFVTDAPFLATTNTSLNTIIGCGTAYGCGTVNGSGTVYLPPFGLLSITSSGVVSGCVKSVVGCGVMLGTSGTFSGSATVVGCGEGSGMATMIGVGTVYPAGFTPAISFVSSGTVSGSGRVVGCGTLMGSGAFTVTGPPTNLPTVTARKTVNVYVSYCPDNDLSGGSLGRIAQYAAGGNVSSGDSTASNSDSIATSGNYLLDATFPNTTLPNLINNTFPSNSTISNGILKNPLCHICPNDSGICCPLFVDCGADGHCPYQALLGAGYVKFGVNVVEMANSSTAIGGGTALSGKTMNTALRAPGKPGNFLDWKNDATNNAVGADTAMPKLRRRIEREMETNSKWHLNKEKHSADVRRRS